MSLSTIESSSNRTRSPFFQMPNNNQYTMYESRNKMTTFLPKPRPSQIPLLLSQSESSISTTKNTPITNNMVHSVIHTNTLNTSMNGSCEELSFIGSPYGQVQKLLDECSKKRTLSVPRYSKPSLIIPLKRDVPFCHRTESAQSAFNSMRMGSGRERQNVGSSGLGSSFISTRSLSLSEEEEDEEAIINEKVEKHMAFTKYNQFIKVYRNTCGGFEQSKELRFLYLSNRGTCRFCRHVPASICTFNKKIGKKNVVKKKCCICHKLLPSTEPKLSPSKEIEPPIKRSYLDTPCLFEYYLLILLLGMIAFIVEFSSGLLQL